MKIKELKNINFGETDLNKVGKKTIKFVKVIFVVFILLVTIVSAVNGILFLYEENKLTKVTVGAEILKAGDKRCDFQKPVYVTLTNISEKTIIETTYDIEVKRIGYSSDIAEHELKWPDTDKILLPGESANFCLTLDLKYPYDEAYSFNPFDAKKASLDGMLTEYAENYKKRNKEALKDLTITGFVTSVKYK